MQKRQGTRHLYRPDLYRNLFIRMLTKLFELEKQTNKTLKDKVSELKSYADEQSQLMENDTNIQLADSKALMAKLAISEVSMARQQRV